MNSMSTKLFQQKLNVFKGKKYFVIGYTYQVKVLKSCKNVNNSKIKMTLLLCIKTQKSQ